MFRREKKTDRPPRRKFDASMGKRRPCYFCENKVAYIDYKDGLLRNFVSDKGRIVPAKISGVCHRHQRRLSQAIKRARTLALLPFVLR
jgi:small subunit ribosomal protein S18